MAVRVNFEPPKEGWLQATLLVEQRALDLAISYTPNDFLLDLVVSLSHVAAEHGTFVASANLEPTRADWILDRSNNTIIFSVVEYPNWKHNQRQGRTLLHHAGSLEETIPVFWRGLRKLSTSQSAEIFEKDWRRPFPLREFDVLTTLMRPLGAG